MRPGEGITGAAAAERAPVMIAARGPPRPALQALPQPARGAVRVDPRRADPGQGAAGGSAERPDARPARVHGGRDRAPDGDRGPGRAGDREREAVRERAAGGWPSSRRSRRSRRRCPSRSISRSPCGDRARRRWARCGVGRGARPRGRARRVARGPRGRSRRAAAAALEGPADRRARLRPRHALHRRRAEAPRVDREARRRSRSSTGGGHARRARPGDPPPRQEQPPDRRLAPPAPGQLAGDGCARRRSTTRSTGSSPSPPSTRC